MLLIEHANVVDYLKNVLPVMKQGETIFFYMKGDDKLNVSKIAVNCKANMNYDESDFKNQQKECFVIFVNDCYMLTVPKVNHVVNVLVGFDKGLNS